MTAHAPVYDAEMRKSFGLGFHPNPMGYYAYALMVANYIDYVIRSNPREFATIPFVGTSLKTKITNSMYLLKCTINETCRCFHCKFTTIYTKYITVLGTNAFEHSSFLL